MAILLLKGGTLLVHSPTLQVIPTRADLLIENTLITRIDEDIEHPTAEIVDCTGKLVSPGFISTHHHLWQTQLKGLHANHTLLEYFPGGNFSSVFFEPDDFFWGQLSGALECIDAGTTTVVDHSHLNYRPENVYAALHATVASGLRCVYCYCATPRTSGWKPFGIEMDFFPAWVWDTYEKLAASAPFAGGRVTLGFAHDALWLPKEVMQKIYARIRAAKPQVITHHASGGPIVANRPNALSKLFDCGLLGPDVILSHHNHPSKEEVEILAKSGAWVSSTPGTELHMGMGELLVSSEETVKQSSLGTDCHSCCSPSLPTQMHLALAHSRAARAQALSQDGTWSRDIGMKAEEMFNLATVQNAKAAGLSAEVGQLKVGLKADIVVFDGTSPSMLVASEQDPVAAIILHSSIRDVETVIVDGTIRKAQGRLVDTHVDQGEFGKGMGRVGWSEVVGEVRKSREKVAAKVRDSGADLKEAEERVAAIFHFNMEQERS